MSPLLLSASPPNKMTIHEIPQIDVSVIPANDSSDISPEIRQALGSLLQYSVIVENRTGESLQGVALYWERHYTDGKIVPAANYIKAPTKAEGAMIAPGDKVFMTPIGTFSRKLPIRMHGVIPTTVLDRIYLQATEQWDNVASVDLWLDAIVFVDDSLVGPDKRSTLQQKNREAAARRSIAAQVMGMENASAKAYLQRIADGLDNQADDPHGAGKYLAQVMLRYVEQDPRPLSEFAKHILETDGPLHRRNQ